MEGTPVGVHAPWASVICEVVTDVLMYTRTPRPITGRRADCLSAYSVDRQVLRAQSALIQHPRDAKSITGISDFFYRY